MQSMPYETAGPCRVAVVGTGYVGLVTGACLAALGATVTCVDNDVAKLERLKQGRAPFYEPHLDALLAEQLGAGRLAFTPDLPAAVRHAEFIFIAVGTPAQPDGNVDLSAVSAVATGIGRALDDSCSRVVINKSTVPIGSGDWVAMLVQEGMGERAPARVGAGNGAPAGPAAPVFEVLSNPEFLREGSAVADTLFPDRIVLGSNAPWAVARALELYEPIISQRFAPPAGLARRDGQGVVPVLVTDPASAELIKYAANAFLATKISFINEIANIAERVGADVNEVAKGMGLDSRIGAQFLKAGLGWGGSCFQKDISALIQIAQEYSYNPAILPVVVEVNTGQRRRIIQKLQDALKILKGKTVGLLGLSFKPHTDDLREAPSLYLAQRLLEMGARVRVTDPVAMTACQLKFPNLRVVYCGTAAEVAAGADALVLVTEWPEYRQLDFGALAGLMRQAVLVDGRNALDRQTLLDAGFTYIGVGV